MNVKVLTSLVKIHSGQMRKKKYPQKATRDACGFKDTPGMKVKG